MFDNATPMDEPLPPPTPSVRAGPSSCSSQEREFARAYVLVGGNATKAAALAGYACPEVAGSRCLTRPRVLDEVRRISIANASALLPIVMRQWLNILCDEEADTRARVMAGEKIANMAGAMKGSGGPAVQVNLQVNGGEAQAVISEVWERRLRRLEDRTSDIAAPMSDVIDAAAEPPSLAPPAAGGGDASPGSHPGPVASTSPHPGRKPEMGSGPGWFAGSAEGGEHGGGDEGVDAWRRASVARSAADGSE